MVGQSSHITVECLAKVILALLISSLSTIVLGHIIARRGLHQLK